MINALDLILKQMFSDALFEALEESGTRTLPHPPLPPDEPTFAVTFGPPDGTNLPTGTTSSLNIYLVDVRENRKLRKNDRVTLGVGAKAVETQAPLRLDCHYLASAWGATANLDVDNILLDHELLYAASAALLRHNPLIARNIFNAPNTLDSEVDKFIATHAPGVFPDFMNTDKNLQGLRDFYTLDPILRDYEIPIDALPPEGYPKIAEFWGLMGGNTLWRPVAYFVATIPVERTRRVRGPEVRSIGTTYFPPLGGDDTEPRGETFFTVGGVVQRIIPDPDPTDIDPVTQAPKDKFVPVPFATVQISYTRSDPKVPHIRERIERVTTDRDGRYIFDRVEAGPVHIEATARVRVSATNHDTAPLTIAITPEPSVPPLRFGEYDFTFPALMPNP